MRAARNRRMLAAPLKRTPISSPSESRHRMQSSTSSLSSSFVSLTRAGEELSPTAGVGDESDAELLSPSFAGVTPDGAAPDERPSSRELRSFEEVLEKVGAFGPFQLLLAICVQLTVLAWTGNYCFITFAMSIEPTWFCNGSSPELETTAATAVAQCDILSRCPRENLTFVSSGEFYSIIEEWELVCSRNYIPNLIATIQMVGTLVGSQLCGYLSDVYGRKPAFMFTYAAMIACGLFSTLAQNWQQMAVLRAFIGFFLYGSMTVNFVWAMEMTDAHHNFVMNIASFWQFGYMLCALLGYVTADWRRFSIAANIVGVPLLFVYLFAIPESPRWLIQKHRLQRAVASLAQIARMNGFATAPANLAKSASATLVKTLVPPTMTKASSCVTLEDLHWVRAPSNEREVATIEQTGRCVAERIRKWCRGAATFFDLFSTRRVAAYTLLTTFSYFVVSLIENSFIFKIGTLHGSPFLNLFLYGLLCAPMPFVAALADKKFAWFGRRVLFLGTLTTVAVFFAIVVACFVVKNVYFGVVAECAAAVASENSVSAGLDIAATVFALCGAVMCSCLWISLGQYVVELFPTAIRNTASGFTSVGDSLGGVFAPTILYLDNVSCALPYVVSFGFSTLNFVLGYFVFPETKGKCLPDNVARKRKEKKRDAAVVNVVDDEEQVRTFAMPEVEGVRAPAAMASDDSSSSSSSGDFTSSTVGIATGGEHTRLE